MTAITSTANPRVQALRALHSPKGRAETGLFLVEGPHLLDAALDASVLPSLTLFAPEVLERTEITSDMKRILFGTRNSHLWAKGESKFQTDFVGITEDGAEWLVARGVQLVGVDYLSVAPYADVISPHLVLLRQNVIVVEGLNLSGVMRGFYDLYCLPLKIAGCEGAPARAILIQS